MTESPAAQSFAKAAATSPPFDSARLDALLDEAGIDALVISSKHNIQYLFGGYRFFFFDHFDAIGVSRYLPILIYVKGRPDQSTYIGQGMEAYERELGKFWTPAFQASGTSLHSAQLAIDHIKTLGPKAKRIGIERSFLPADAAELMARRTSRRHIRRSASAARTPEGAQDRRRAGSASHRVRPRGRLHAGGDRLAWARRDKSGRRRSAST